MTVGHRLSPLRPVLRRAVLGVLKSVGDGGAPPVERLTISGTGFVLNGAAWIPYGMSDGHFELTRTGDEAIDVAMGATSLRTVVRTYGTYGTGFQQDMQEEGQPGNLKPAYLAEIVRRLTASRAAGMRNGIANDSNKGQGAEASGGNDFFGGLTEGDRQKELFFQTAEYLAANYGDLIDWMEPIVEPNSAVVANKETLWAFQEAFMTRILAVAPHMLFAIGPRDYSAGNVANAINPAWLDPGSPFYGKVFITCNFLSNLSMDEAQRVTRAASVATARTTSGVPAWINQIATHVADDPTDVNLDATMALLDAASGGPIGLCYWERVSMSGTADGLRYLSNTADPNSARLTHDARIGVVQAHFTGVPYWMTAPAIVGTPTEGELVAYTTGTAAGRPAPTLAARVRVNGVDKGDAASYTIQAGDVGLPVVIRQTATNTAGAVASDSAPVDAVAAASSTYGSQLLLAANVGPTIEYTTPIWVNLNNAGRACWCPSTDNSGFGYTSVTLKSDGYPDTGTTSTRVFRAEVVDYDAGDYLFECAGDMTSGGASITIVGTGTWFVAPSFSGGKTTATLRVPTGQDGSATISLRFNSVPSDFGGVKLHSPGYALASTQKVRTDYVTHMGPFPGKRYMDLEDTNGPDAAFAGGGNQDTDWAGSLAAGAGHVLKYPKSLDAVFDIATACSDTFIWSNIPAKATDNYIDNYVPYGAALRPSGALWNIEFGNELWNGNLGESTAYTDIRTAAFTAASVKAGADIVSLSRTSNVVTAQITGHGKTTGDTIYVRQKAGLFTEGSEVITVTDADHFTWADTGSDGAIAHADDDTFIFLDPTHTLCRSLTNYYEPEHPTANYVRIRYMLTRAKKIYDAIATAGETANVKVSLGVWMASTFNYVPCIAWAVEEYGGVSWLYAMPPALYMEPETPNSFASVTDVFTQLDTNASDVTLPRALRWNNLMLTWGMRRLGYESGPHTHTADGDSVTYVLQAHEDDRMRQRLKSWQHSWTNRGGEQLMFFHAGVAKAPTTPNATWPVTYGDFTDDATSVKYAAFTELAGESALAVQESGVNFGTINYVDALPDSGAFLGQVSTWLVVRPEKSVPDVTIGVAVDADGTYTLAVDACRHTDAAVAYEAFVDDVSISSGNLPAGNIFTTAPGQAFSVSVSLTAGYHRVTLHVPNASRADWVGLYQVRLT